VTGDTSRPIGRDAVRRALIDATTQLAIEQGLSMSVRDIAARAGVNHGLVHTYFGSKDALISAAFDDINLRAAAETRHDGFPPLDLASRRGGELVKALARLMLDADRDLFTSHPVLEGWRDALTRDRSDLGQDEVAERIAVAAAVGLGWALFADLVTTTLGMDPDGRASADARVTALFTEIGAVPPFA
jgi:AcrR family transcriptional regulator